MADRSGLWLCQGQVMRAVGWDYMCDHGHRWHVAEDEPDVEPDPGVCPEGGHRPVTASRRPWADRPHFHLHPAAVLTDTVRGSIADEGLYYLEVQDGSATWTWSTPSPVNLDDAIRLMIELSRAPTREAILKMERMGFTEG